MPQTILSSNSKTGCSINLPIKGHCHPTKNCARTCYAKSGLIAFPNSTRKQSFVSKYLAGRNLNRLIQECRDKETVRINGTGDLNKEHIKNVLRLANVCPDTQFYGMTRKVEIAQAFNNKLPNLRMLLSVDSSSPESVWKYKGKMCWGPRMKEDTVPNDPRIIVVFPYHCNGSVIKNMPHHDKDCKAVWHEIDGCMSCGRCWKW